MTDRTARGSGQRTAAGVSHRTPEGLARLATAAVLLAALTTCGRPAPSGPAPASAECVVVDDAARSRITIGVAGPGAAFDAGAYSAAHIAGAQLHETLVRVGCAGDVTAAVADEWSSSDGTHWRFRIGRGLTFADSTPVDAHTIIAAWSAARTPLLASVAAGGAYDLSVTLHAPADAHLFALPELSIVRRTAGDWPAGTGPYSPDSVMPDRTLRLVARPRARVAGVPDAPLNAAAAAGRAPDTIDVRTFGADPRTAIDAGVDALVTGDAATAAYARARSGYAIVPLPWNRTYVIATASPIDAAADASAPGMAFPDDVVSVAARPALAPFWWQECGRADAATPRSTTDGRILYARDDPTARAIAERVTALARDRAPSWLRALLGPNHAAPSAAGVSRSELLDALRAGSPLAVVTSLPRLHYAGCGAPSPEPYSLLASRWRVVPLIDTRDNLIYRPGIGRIVADGDGMVRFGWR